MKPVAVALGAAFVTSLAGTSIANAAENPFGMTELSSGYMVAEEGKCGGMKKGDHDSADKMKKEGKCGEGMDKSKMDKEGKCGEGMDKSKMDKEGKCGEGMDKSKMKKEGKCGEGKCGGNKMKKDGEGKCGGKK
ncbi:MAG TPA: hypothetical protein ENK49_02590 [Gammaproteobacteria bacterium]|nr:hypothetical protein [Gammaproteobacteria bacterium]